MVNYRCEQVKSKVFALLCTLVISLSYGVAFAGQDETGNGAPSGAHYNLNIIGVSKDKSADMDGNNGHRIFVPLSKKAKIEPLPGALPKIPRTFYLPAILFLCIIPANRYTG